MITVSIRVDSNSIRRRWLSLLDSKSWVRISDHRSDNVLADIIIGDSYAQVPAVRSGVSPRYILTLEDFADISGLPEARSAIVALVHRDDSDEDFIRAMHEVLSGLGWVSPQFALVWISSNIAASVLPAVPEMLDKLTKRELEVASLASDGLTNLEIANTLHVSVRTVRFHISNALGKLGCRNRIHLGIALRAVV